MAKFSPLIQTTRTEMAEQREMAISAKNRTGPDWFALGLKMNGIELEQQLYTVVQNTEDADKMQPGLPSKPDAKSGR